MHDSALLFVGGGGRYWELQCPVLFKPKTIFDLEIFEISNNRNFDNTAIEFSHYRFKYLREFETNFEKYSCFEEKVLL